MPEPKDEQAKTYQNESGEWVTDEYGRTREATSEEVEEKLEEYEEAEKASETED